MADRFRLVTIGADGRARLVLELNDTTAGIWRERDTFTYTPAARRDRAITGDRRYQGARVIDVAHDNATVAVTLNVSAGSVALAAVKVEDLLEAADRLVAEDGLYIEWRPENLPRSVYFPVRGPATVAPAIRTRALVTAGFVPVAVTWPVAPLAEGLPMDIRERWQPPPDKDGGIVNYVPNPRGIDTGGWTSSAPAGSTNVPLAAVIDAAEGPMLEAGYTAGTFATNSPLVIAPPSPTVPVGGWLRLTPDVVRVGLRARVKVQAVSGTTVSSLSVEWRAYNASATIIAGSGTVSIQNAPVTGTVYDISGAIDRASIPAGAVWVYMAVRAVVPSGGPSSLTIRATRFMLTSIPAGAATPAYLDGDSDTGRWLGDVLYSRSVELAESKLADWTVLDPPANGRVYVEGGAVPALRSDTDETAAADSVVLAHRGRGYAYRDFAMTAELRVGDTQPQTTRRGPGKRLVNLNPAALEEYVYARINRTQTTGATDLVLVRVSDGVETVIQTVSLTAPASGSTVWVRFVIRGNQARGEYWTVAPALGGTPTSATSWAVLPDLYAGEGEPLIVWQAASRTERIGAVDVEPYTFPPGGQQKSPTPYALRGIPGNAPAKAEVEVAPASSIAHPFALLAWRKRSGAHNILWNGEADPDLDDWETTGTGLAGTSPTVTRNVGGANAPPDGGPYVEITAAATLNQGVRVVGFERMKRGALYVLEFYAQWVSGSWEAYVIGDASVAGAPVTALELDGPDTAWRRYSIVLGAQTVTPASSSPAQVTASQNPEPTEVAAYFRTDVAATGTLRVARVRVYEALDILEPTAGAARSRVQSAGRGGRPPFGVMWANDDDTSARVGFTEVFVAGSASGRRLRVNAASVTFATADYLIDPLLSDLGDSRRRGELDVEVYAYGSLPSIITNPRLEASIIADGITAIAAPTREWQGGGRPLTLPPGVAATRTWRIGTVTIPVLPELADQRLRLRLTFTCTANASAGSMDVEYLVLVPRDARASTPTGLVNDSSYPAFIAAQASAASKVIRPNLAGRIVRPGIGAGRDTGLAGAPLELPPGDVDLVAWLQSGAVPDDPSATTASALDATVGVRVGITPRYRLLNDSTL